MICPYCHEETPDDSAFCTECGKRLTSAPAETETSSAASGAPVAPGAVSASSAPSGATAAPAAASAAPQSGDKTDGLAVASLVCSIVGVVAGFTIPLVLSILGIIFGAIARGRNPKNSTNGKLALAGLVVGIVGLVLIVAIVAAVIAFGFAISAGAFGWAFE